MPSKKHIVATNDHIIGLAEENGLHWETIWNDRANRRLKRKRKNPAVLFHGDRRNKGDVLRIPRVRERTVSRDIDNAHVFTRPRVNRHKLNLRILFLDHSPVKDSDYELKIDENDDQVFTGTTDGNGEIKIDELPLDAQKGLLTVKVQFPDTSEAENREGDEDALVPEDRVMEAVPCTWELKIGALNPILEKAPNKRCIAGVQQRLNNLGIDAGPVDGVNGHNTKAAVKTFQSLFESLRVDGVAGKKTLPKLQELHDKNEAVTLDGEKRTYSPPENKKKETGQKDIGFVAAYIDDQGEFENFNTLVVRPQYRISMKLGDIDRLFPWPVTTPAGRLARMQVLGLFYWPLHHRTAAGITNQVLTAGMTANQDGYRTAWRYFKEKFCGVASASLDTPDADVTGQEELEKRLKEWIIQRYDGTRESSRYNRDGTAGGGLLPRAAEEDAEGNPTGVSESDGHFAKLRLPGGWSFFSPGQSQDPNRDTAINGMNMENSQYALESRCYGVNPVLGKIPLIATAEKYWPDEKKWKPAGDVQIYFQLLKPYDLPDFDENRKSHLQLNRPPLIGKVYSVTHPTPANYDGGQGPKYFMEEVWEKYGHIPDNPNPLAGNCHKDCGGKRGHAIDGTDPARNIFFRGEYSGFSKEHDPPPNNIIQDQGNAKRNLDPAPDLNKTSSVGSSSHPYSIKCKTNENGEAGCIFMPSRCSGDRYRIRAYIGPDTLEGEGSDGKGKSAVKVDTGTFVTWRNLRFSRFVRQNITGWDQFPAKIVNHIHNRPAHLACTEDERKVVANFFGLLDPDQNWIGFPDIDLDTLSGGGAGSDFDGIRVAFAKGFCELDCDPDLGEEVKDGKTVLTPENLGNAEWRQAVDRGLNDARTFQSTDPFNQFHLTKLLYRMAPQDNDIDVDNGFLIPARRANPYRAVVGNMHPSYNFLTAGGGGLPANSWKVWIGAAMIKTYIAAGFMRHITKNGFLPGVTVVQSAALSNLAAAPGYGVGGLRGRGTHFAGAFVLLGKKEYADTIGHDPINRPGGYTPTVLHELGHVFFKVHAPGKTPGPDHAAEHQIKRHDSYNDYTANEDPKHGACVMSYRTCEGYFCSRCLLQLMGWKVQAGSIADKNVNSLSFDAVPKAQNRHTKVYARPGTAVTFTVTASGGSGNFTYSWSGGSGLSSTDRNPSHRYGTAGTFQASVTVTDVSDASKTATGSISVHVTEPVDFTAGPSVNPERPAPAQEASFSVTASGGTGSYVYAWDFGDGTAISDKQDPAHTFAARGSKTVTLTVTDKDDDTNTKQETMTLTVADPISFTAGPAANPGTGAVNESIGFSVTPAGGTGSYSYQWRFGDDSWPSTAAAPGHRYETVGTFTASVKVWDPADSGNLLRQELTVRIN